jgi:hypothetical protein
VFAQRLTRIRATALVADAALLGAWQQSIRYLFDVQVRRGGFEVVAQAFCVAQAHTLQLIHGYAQQWWLLCCVQSLCVLILMPYMG